MCAVEYSMSFDSFIEGQGMRASLKNSMHSAIQHASLTQCQSVTPTLLDAVHEFNNLSGLESTAAS
jgi:hypothetical protein